MVEFLGLCPSAMLEEFRNPPPADKVGETAKYVRSHGAKDILSDVEHFVRKNPGKSVIAAAAVGFLVDRALRSSSD